LRLYSFFDRHTTNRFAFFFHSSQTEQLKLSSLNREKEKEIISTTGKENRENTFTN
jgi:hypothetical protein